MSAKRTRSVCAVVALLGASCGASDERSITPTVDTESESSGIRLISAEAAFAIHSAPPDDLIILDVRTAEEFSESHLEGAILIDFYSDDFAEQLGELDPNVPYLLYCRSGNRSGQTVPIMEKLGFVDVVDIDGGIQAWAKASLPTVAP